MARRVAARRRLPAGAEDLGRDLSRSPRCATPATAPSGTARRAGTASPSWPRATSWSSAGAACPATRTTRHSRYLEASAHGIVVASIYLPNGNPQPGPKFDYKLAWFERLAAHAREPVRAASSRSSWRATTTSSPATRSATSTRRARTSTTRCCSRRRAAPTAACSPRAGPTRSPRCTRASRSTPTGTTSATASARRRPAHRPPAAQRAGGGAAGRGRRRQERARAREAERPRADLDRPG